MVLHREDVAGQGSHIDPEDPATAPPSKAQWTAAHRRAQESRTLGLFSDALRPPGGGSVRDGVIGDLAEYYHLSPAQVIDRCLHWEDASVEEWEAAPRDTPAGLAQFYDSVESWSFDLLWYAYLQSSGYGYPETVIVADQAGRPPGGARMLDLGSGAGVTAQLFASLGYEVTLADVSAPLLAFARWRLERRGVQATYLHLPTEMPEASYDLITALDVMAHVPDPAETAQRLHRALRPGGLFVTNFDVRRRSSRNAWHLWEDDLPLRWAVQRAGFSPVTFSDGILRTYRACPATGPAWRLRSALAWVRLASPLARATRTVRRTLARAALITMYRLRAKSREGEAQDHGAGHNGNRQKAPQKIAQITALEAGRTGRRNWIAGIAAAALVIIAATGLTLGVTRSGGGPGAAPELKLGSLSPLKPAPAPGPAGPEGVPVPGAGLLASTAAAAAGKEVDGIRCQPGEQAMVHIHAHLAIFVNGVPRQVPAGIGIPRAQARNTAQGAFVSGGSCFYWVHTHAADGIIHVESPVQRTYTLGDFFDEWGQPLGPDRVGPVTGPVVAIYDGQRYQGNPRGIPLNAHAQIQLEAGTPLVAPVTITFPGGV